MVRAGVSVCHGLIRWARSQALPTSGQPETAGHHVAAQGLRCVHGDAFFCFDATFRSIREIAVIVHPSGDSAIVYLLMINGVTAPGAVCMWDGSAIRSLNPTAMVIKQRAV